MLPRMVMGGVERITLNLVRQLSAGEVVCALALGRVRGELIDEARSITEVFELAPRGLHQFVPRLARLLGKWKPTHIVVAFGDIALLTIWARRAARSSAPIVYGVHNSHGPETMRKGSFGKLRYEIDQRIFRAVYRRVDAAVVTSTYVMQEVRDRFDIESNRLVLIPNPVVGDDDLARISSAYRNSNAARIRIVAIGRFVHQKGFDLLISAMEKLDATLVWTLDIFGDGPARDDLEKLVRESSVSGRITLRGITADPIATLLSADIFVLPSRFEGLPTILIQALACGLQIVAADCPHGPREILADGALGELVSPGDPFALANGLERVLRKTVSFNPDAMRERAGDFSASRAAQRWRHLLQNQSAESRRTAKT